MVPYYWHATWRDRLKVMKLMIMIGVTVGGTLGGWIGALMAHGNWFSAASILLGAVGSFVGIWAAYKAGQYYGD
jgi:CHASE2 domain-containing sensor protein